MMFRLKAVVLAVTLAVLPNLVRADGVVLVVRHAEKAPDPKKTGDPSLTEAGVERAHRLARMLADAGITAIVTSQYQRCVQTAATLAAALKLTPIVIAADKPDDLAALVKTLRQSGSVLVVGHSNTVPDLLSKLGDTRKVKIGDAEFDNLFIVAARGEGEAVVVRLHY